MPIQLVRNDIVKMNVDAIVNAANSSLLGGGGVDGAIHRAAGPGLLEECRRLGGCQIGQAKITGGYNLPCRYVIHTVGPVWQGGGHGEAELLASCYRNALELAREKNCATVAFPLISTGRYGYPKSQALEVAIAESLRFLDTSDMTVYIVFYTKEAVELGSALFGEIAAYIDDVYVQEHYNPLRESRRLPPTAQTQASISPIRDGASVRPDIYLNALNDEDAEIELAAFHSSLDDMLRQIDESFAQTLLRRIDERGMTDAECYHRANVDRRLFNKIKNTPSYRPSKQTVLAFAIALRLNLEETKDLLMKAGFALSRSSKADIVVEYCILTGHYDIMEINQVLFGMDLQPLGY